MLKSTTAVILYNLKIITIATVRKLIQCAVLLPLEKPAERFVDRITRR